MPSSVLVCLLLCFLAGHVQAHGRMFQPALEPPAENSLRANATTIEKRWVGVEHGFETYSTKLWPDGNIQYAFKDKELEELWDTQIDLAVRMWNGVGVEGKNDQGKDMFQWNKVTYDECTRVSNRLECLVISKSPGNSYYCDTGLRPRDAQNNYNGPNMLLPGKDNPDTWPMGSLMHEMGHCWGLKHEHQNPQYWPKKYHASQAYDGNIFSEKNFDCKALPDYNDAVQAVRENPNRQANDEEELCTRFKVAEFYKFSAAAFLPLADQFVVPAASENDIDWDSIMLYYTDMGELGKIIKKPDGSDIDRPMLPTERDGAAIMSLYSYKYATAPIKLLIDDSNPSKSTFDKQACMD